MPNRLLDLDGETDLVDVTYDDDPAAKWTIGFELQNSASASTLTTQDPCSKQSSLLAGAINASPKVYIVSAFAAAVSARRNVRCAIGEELEIVQSLLVNGGVTSAVESALWFGVSGWDPNLQPSLANSDVATATNVPTSIPDTLANVVNRYSALTAIQDYVIHLGVKAALELSALGYAYSMGASGQLFLRATGAPIVVSPYYPSAGVALTGPLEIFVGVPDAWQVYDSLLNRTNINGNQLIALAFDPSTAVLAA